MEQNIEKNNENCVEFLSGERYMVVSLTNRKHINRIKKLYQERKEAARIRLAEARKKMSNK